MPNVELQTNLPLAEILTRWPETIPVFLEHRMACVGCALSAFDTLEEALVIYRDPAGTVLAAINRAISNAAAYPGRNSYEY